MSFPILLQGQTNSGFLHPEIDECIKITVLQGFDVVYGFLDQRVAHHYYVDSLWKNQKKIPVDLSEEIELSLINHEEFERFNKALNNWLKETRAFLPTERNSLFDSVYTIEKYGHIRY